MILFPSVSISANRDKFFISIFYALSGLPFHLKLTGIITGSKTTSVLFPVFICLKPIWNCKFFIYFCLILFKILNGADIGDDHMILTLYEPFRHWSETGSVYILSDPHFGDSD